MKAWETAEFYVTSIRKQFVRDLQNMGELGDIQWIFKQNAFWGDAAAFKNKIKEALMPGGVPCAEIVAAFNAPGNKLKFSKWFKISEDKFGAFDPAGFITKLMEESNFEKIFTIP
jgi:hypothetical protein